MYAQRQGGFDVPKGSVVAISVSEGHGGKPLKIIIGNGCGLRDGESGI